MNREMRRMAEREERRNKQQGDRRRSPIAGAPGGDGSATGRLGRLVQFLREVRVELSRVNWPNRRQMIAFTTVTVITTGVLTGYVFLVDLALSRSVLAGIRALTG
ncbi:MAG: preprotein translocase subunit SecE [Acidimicrobiia bacterium]|nr:preprotein translocase subunit SecE [Acidimicrobiia bacterium]MYF83767.1 preprotein translocase subunit SecE [Acidimicrobiia bacterium]